MKIEKIEKFVANLNDETEYVIHIRILKQALNHGLVWKKNLKWLNLIKMLGYNYIFMWILIKKKSKKKKNDFEKDFYKLMNNVAFEITIGNMGKQEDIKLVTTERRRNCLVSKRNDQTTAFSKNRDAFGKKKTEMLLNCPFYLGISILALNGILI